MRTAIFIGGAFDMTKREMCDTPATVTFFEPVDPGFLANFSAPYYTVPCRVLEYERMFKTPQGVYVYEFQRIKK